MGRSTICTDALRVKFSVSSQITMFTFDTNKHILCTVNFSLKDIGNSKVNKNRSRFPSITGYRIKLKVVCEIGPSVCMGFQIVGGRHSFMAAGVYSHHTLQVFSLLTRLLQMYILKNIDES